MESRRADVVVDGQSYSQPVGGLGEGRLLSMGLRPPRRRPKRVVSSMSRQCLRWSQASCIRFGSATRTRPALAGQTSLPQAASHVQILGSERRGLLLCVRDKGSQARHVELQLLDMGGLALAMTGLGTSDLDAADLESLFGVFWSGDCAGVWFCRHGCTSLARVAAPHDIPDGIGHLVERPFCVQSPSHNASFALCGQVISCFWEKIAMHVFGR